MSTAESAPPTLESLFKDVRRAGFKVNNLFHRMDGMWQANLRRDNTLYFEWAYGVDAADAMEKALAKAQAGKTASRADFRAGDDDLDPAMVGTTKGDGSAPMAPEEGVNASTSETDADVNKTGTSTERAAPAPVVEDEDDLVG